ncbi:hypothetical protein [Leptospira adleri]|uniref:hypothetical protein n=1 Tax=Leptospira adleri TaxID=2023186 RepID=UPI0010835E1F|nr:hypothetical protein [Leptospira adleri]TGM58886.1 hypothetical protein EHQ97_07320 [Leptospira adleri]
MKPILTKQNRVSNDVPIIGGGYDARVKRYGKAYLDGIPMLILSGGVRTDTGRSYQLYQIHQFK